VTGFSYVNKLQKKNDEDIGLPEQKRQAAIAERAQPETKMLKPATNDPAVSISAPPPAQLLPRRVD